MANSSSQPTQVPATSDVSPALAQPSPNAPLSAEGLRATMTATNHPGVQMPTSLSNAGQLNTPLAGFLNSKPPLFYIKASASQLKAIIQSAPEEVRTRIRANASKEAMLDEIFKLRQQEALIATDQPQEVLDPHEALRKLLTMDPEDVPTAVDTSPENVRKLMKAALHADSTLTPRVVPEDRHNIIYTVLTWQVNTHKIVNPSCQPPTNQQPAHGTPVPDQHPPHMPSNPTQGVIDIHATAEAARQPATNEQQRTALNDILALPPMETAQTRAAHAAGLQDLDDSDDEAEMRRKRARENSAMETWIEGFHTGADAALEQTLSSYPENRPGANRLNVTSFRGPKILGKIISRNMGLQQHVATFPFWKKSGNGRPTQSQMEAHNIARMMQLEILAHASPLEALRHRPSLEVGLRRLYAIMYVEKQIATGEMSDRGSAWQNIEFLLESTPSDISTCDDIEEEMTRRLTQSKRRIAATKAIKDSDSRRNKRAPNNKSQTSSQDGNKRRYHGAETDNHKE